MNIFKIIILSLFLLLTVFSTKQAKVFVPESKSILPILTAADQPEQYLPILEGKKIGLVVNQTAILASQGDMHLVDFLMMEGLEVVKVFVPEHGFRGDADAGEVIKSEIDKNTGLPIVSLYGDNKKPKPEQLHDIDILIYDLQDVGVRFYTYISTMHYVMEACAEQNKTLLILDRPNPNADYIDGPVLQKGFESFVGMHPIPVVHGLTVGELAQMINGEGWLKNKVKAPIQIIPVKNWNRTSSYSLPVKPSPNLPNDLAIRLYPSLCYFEGTDVSLGRGTLYPFQLYGYPDPKFGDFTFTPVSIVGMSKNPPQQNKLCYGVDLRQETLDHRFTLQYLLHAYSTSGKKEKFFNNFFDKLAGTDQLRKDILAGKNETQIRNSWKSDLDAYQAMRTKYLIYE